MCIYMYICMHMTVCIHMYMCICVFMYMSVCLPTELFVQSNDSEFNYKLDSLKLNIRRVMHHTVNTKLYVF